MIVITKTIDGKDHRLCQDGKWRWFANFGTFAECVKEYRSLGHAKRRAKRVKGEVVVVGEGMAMDAVGNLAQAT